MKLLLHYLIFISLLLIGHSAHSQDFEVPVNYKLDKAEDYAPYEARVIACIDCLEKTPINEEKAKRTAAKAFLSKMDRVNFKLRKSK